MPPRNTSDAAKTDQLLELLRKKYPTDRGAFAFFENIADATGTRASRWADALVMSLWPSRGLTMTGFEVKASRSDWMRELADPSKAEAVMRFCDHWYLVVADASIVQPDELPATWGLMRLDGRRLVTSKPAPKLEPEPMDRAFIASILRHAFEFDERRARRHGEERYREGIEKGKDVAATNEKALQRDLDDLQKSIAEFEERSGVRIDRWDGGRIGAAVQEVLRRPNRRHQLVNLVAGTERLLAQLRADLEELESDEPAVTAGS